MENRIKLRLAEGKRLTRAQARWAEDLMGKYEDECLWCEFNLRNALGMLGNDFADKAHAAENHKTP